MKGLLYLLPNVLADIQEHALVLPISVDRTVDKLDHLIAESEKQGRCYLKRFAYSPPKTFRDITIHLLNEHTLPQERRALLDAIVQGGTWGLISDCGMPCLADPGDELVLEAKERGICIKAFAGPSSIMLALVQSGLGGQCFTFWGYLSREESLRSQKIKEMERLLKKERSVHLFIETPYRNQKLFSHLLTTLDNKTWLSLATDLTLSTEYVMTKRVEQWKKIPPPSIDKRATVFVVRSF